MALFGVGVIGTESSLRFMLRTHENLQIDNFVRNPFQGGVVYCGTIRKKTYELQAFGIDMRPTYPHFYLVGLLWILLAVIFGGGWGWYVPGLAILGCGFFWSSSLFYILIWLGLHKAGYKGPIKRIELRALLRGTQRLKPLSVDQNFRALIEGFNHPLPHQERRGGLEDG